MSQFFRVDINVVVMVLVALLMSACAKTSTTVSNTSPDSIQVFYTPPTDKEYTEIGLVTTQTGQTIFHDRSTEGMIKKLKAEAAAIGADAIIVRSAEEGSWGLKGGGTTGFDRGKAQAVAIKFK